MLDIVLAMNVSEVLEESHNNSQQDNYPSRIGNQPKFLERLDPVVYGNNPGPLSAQQLKDFEQQGFLIIEDVLNAQEVAEYQQALDDLRQNEKLKNSAEAITEPNSGDIRSIFRIHESSEPFSQLASDQRLVARAQQILNDQVYIHQSRLNYKPGFRGKEFYWHSDFETWHVEDGMPNMRALSMSISLTENHEHNGPLMLIPGSHKAFLSCEGETPDENFKSSLKKQEYGVPDDKSLSAMVEQGGIVSVKSKPGSVIIFDCNIMHGSNGNITPYPRSNVFFVYNAISNVVTQPFCEQPPRPEYICSRKKITALRA